MAAATFRHLASRNLDPQLHTHAVIANMTRGQGRGLAAGADIPARTLQGFLTRYRDVGDGIAHAGEDGRSAQGPGRRPADPRRSVHGGHDPDAGADADRGADGCGKAGTNRRPPPAAVSGGRPALRPAAGRRDARGTDGRGGAPARRGPEKPWCCTWWRTSRAWRWRSSARASWRRRATSSAGRRRSSGSTSIRPCAPARRSSRPRTSSGPRSMTPSATAWKTRGCLHGPALEIERYVNLHLTRSQKGEVANYRPGDIAGLPSHGRLRRQGQGR